MRNEARDHCHDCVCGRLSFDAEEEEDGEKTCGEDARWGHEGAGLALTLFVC